MKRITVPLFAALFVLAAMTSVLPARAVTDEQVYTCEPILYPGGAEGVAIVRVEISSTAATTVMVTVEYYSAGKARYLGSYADWSNSGDYPKDGYEAEAFALKHFIDRQ